MKKTLLSAILFSSIFALAQGPIVEAWQITDGTKASYTYYPNPMSATNPTFVQMTDSADILSVCYNSTNVYVKSNDLPSYEMGPWSGNPNKPSAHSGIYKFPATPQEETGTRTDQPSVGAMGLATNGIVFYGLSDARSYNDEGYWNQNAWATEGETMGPDGGGHPQQQGEYHYHATPAKLYTDPSTAHSPIVGFAFDGYPIYGPFGYTDPNDAGSAIKRIKSSYQERSITQRTTYADGSNAPSPGPNVNTTYPIGYYIEDHEYISSLGDLDEFNGRFCKTPEYPSGTYAYFITTDDNGDPAFPYIVGLQYYGKVSTSDIGVNSGKATVPSGTTCLNINNPTVGIALKETENINIYPNPTNGNYTVSLGVGNFNVTVLNILGEQLFINRNCTDKVNFDFTNYNNGVYFVSIIDNESNQLYTHKIVKK